jgi:hypothetical protein
MQRLAELNDNVLVYTMGFLNVNESAAMAITAKQFPDLVKLSSRLLLSYLSSNRMAQQFLSPKKCMKVNFETIRRFLKLALAYLACS